MSIITLTTDYGLKDHFVGSLKGKIYSEDATAVIVDISHNVEQFDILQASYIISSALNSFPKNTIHIIGVDCEKDAETEHVAMLWEGQYFIAADNGVLGLIAKDIKPEKIVTIDIHDRLHATATDLDVFVMVAMHIRRGGLLNVIGKEIKKPKTVNGFASTVNFEGDSITGSVIYNDNFGNAVISITQKLFLEVSKGRPYEIMHGFKNENAKNIILRTIFPAYSDLLKTGDSKKMAHEGKLLGIFNEGGYLEIAIYRSSIITGDAKTLLGLRYKTPVTINFINK